MQLWVLTALRKVGRLPTAELVRRGEAQALLKMIIDVVIMLLSSVR